MKSLALLLCEVILIQALGCSRDSSFMPENGVPISTQIPASVQAVIPTLQFECQALITGGNIQAIGDLNIDLQIWRPQESTGTFYNLVWMRPFRMRSGSGGSGTDTPVNASFTSNPGVPVRPGDVIGFHSLVSPRLLFDTSQQHEVYYLEAGQGPLCNFSLNGIGVRHTTIPLPFISLTYVNATDEEVQLAEERLPFIGNTCTPVPLVVDSVVTTTTLTTLTVSKISGTDSSLTSSQGQQVTTEPSSPESVNSRGGSDSSDSQGLQVTTGPSSADSESAGGSSTTEGDTDGGFFLALSLTEFILVAVVVAVVLISICVVMILALCCCMYVQHMTHRRGKDEPQISMNTNPVYDTIRTQAGQRPCPGTQPPCASTQQPTLIALVPQPCNQALLQANTQQAVCQQALSDTRLIASSTGSLNSIITPCQQQNLMHPSSTEDYSYPNLRLQLQDYNNQQHVSDDGYVIVQPDQCVQGNTQVEENVCTDVENCGPRGAMDDTL